MKLEKWPLRFELSILQGIMEGYPLCCILSYFFDRIRKRPAWRHRLAQFFIEYSEQPEAQEFWDRPYVPCPRCMRRFLRSAYGI